MSSRKKQSHSKTKFRRRSLKSHKTDSPRITMPKPKRFTKPHSTKIQGRTFCSLTTEEKAKANINSLQKEITLYRLRKSPNKHLIDPEALNLYTTVPKNLLTQIQRKLGKLEELLPILKDKEPRAHSPLKQDYESIQQTLVDLGYYQELEKLEKDYESKDLIKNPRTNHYPNVFNSAPFLY